MKKKSLLLTAVAMLGLTAATLAQNVPNYVPTNGLIGWWPFNGNANDESGNGNNGTVNGATLTSDRFGNVNNALNLAGAPQYLAFPSGNTTSLNITGNFTVSFWIKTTSSSGPLLVCGDNVNNPYPGYFSAINGGNLGAGKIGISTNGNWHVSNSTINNNQWRLISYVFDSGVFKLYIDGILEGTFNNIMPSNSWSGNRVFGCRSDLFMNSTTNYVGRVDDMGIWNRALTQQEITDLYNAVNCANNATITPQTNTLTTGSTATFAASTSDPNPSYLWQCDFGQGFQTLNNFGNYSGTNTANLNIANIQLPNHTQPIRVITTSVNCIDTSNVATISIADTCINTITDTTLITVTDTLIINSTIAALNPPNNSNTIKLFPNPANDHITINYGNFTVMNGYQLKIENSIGQQVFQTNITQQSDYLNLTTWGGNGLYFVHIINPQGNTIDIRKIVLQ